MMAQKTALELSMVNISYKTLLFMEAALKKIQVNMETGRVMPLALTKISFTNLLTLELQSLALMLTHTVD